MQEAREKKLKETGIDIGEPADVPPEGLVELGEPFLDSESSEEDPLDQIFGTLVKNEQSSVVAATLTAWSHCPGIVKKQLDK